MYPKMNLNHGYHVAVDEFYKKIESDTQALNHIIRELKYMFNDTDKINKLITEGEKKFKNTAFQGKIQAMLIYMYTAAEKKDKTEDSIHFKMNKILRYPSDCDDKSRVAPYAAALKATLLHWDVLMPARKITYRGIENPLPTVNNEIITFLGFTSSSLIKRSADEYGDGTTYTITNSDIDRKWQPKLISEFSCSPIEEEALYPPGSFFQVNKVIKRVKSYDIYMTHISVSNDGKF